MLKDVRLYLDEAKALGVPVEISDPSLDCGRRR